MAATVPKIILGIETSCDDTSAAVVREGREVLASVVASQIQSHRPHGGVVPEIASRTHIELLPGVIRQALQEAGLAWSQIDAVAATRGPGLASSLLVGWSAAKGITRRRHLPLCAVNHVEAHIHSVFLDPAAPAPAEVFPLVALVVSGGHTSLFELTAMGKYRLLGRTIDDAAGEALDKGAKLLGLPYPGGPVIDRLSQQVELPVEPVFPTGRVTERSASLGHLQPELCFSFSGLKTSLRQHLLLCENPPAGDEVARIAAAYQEAVVRALVARCQRALTSGAGTLAVGGGVSLNTRLRACLGELCAANATRLLLAPPRYCGDNAAMVAGAAGLGLGIWNEAAFALDVTPTWPVGA